MALAIGGSVQWVLADGRRFDGLIVNGPSATSFFPGEFKWLVQLNSGMQWLEARDLVETSSVTIPIIGGIGTAAPAPSPEEASPVPIPAVTTVGLVGEPGDDLRDGGTEGLLAVGALGGAIVPRLSGIITKLPVGVAVTTVTSFFSRFRTGATVLFETIPDPVRSVLALAGIVGGSILVDQVFFGNGGTGSSLPMSVNAQIVGTWVANGVTFYRLSDGRLAVQNKHGRWKVWRPKKPIVLMPTGAVDLRTLLRADAVLNKQSKRIAAMLNRRAPRRSRSKSAGASDQVVVIDGKVVKT